MVTKKTPKVVLTAVAIVIAAYILSPFYLVLINTFKNANGIVANPVSFAGASFAQPRFWISTKEFLLLWNKLLRFTTDFHSLFIIRFCVDLW